LHQRIGIDTTVVALAGISEKCNKAISIIRRLLNPNDPLDKIQVTKEQGPVLDTYEKTALSEGKRKQLEGLLRQLHTRSSLASRVRESIAAFSGTPQVTEIVRAPAPGSKVDHQESVARGNGWKRNHGSY
jgi:hypothetical protein